MVKPNHGMCLENSTFYVDRNLCTCVQYTNRAAQDLNDFNRIVDFNWRENLNTGPGGIYLFRL